MAVQAQAIAPQKVIVRKVVNAERDRVFDAWTKPELMQQWLNPGGDRSETTNELRVGGEYRHDMLMDEVSHCKPLDKDPKTGLSRYRHSGEYLEITRPERLVFTWSSQAVTGTKVTVDLKDLNGKTEVTITHELLDTEELRASHTEGWTGCLEKLAQLFS